MTVTSEIKIAEDDGKVTITCSGIIDITNCEEFSKRTKEASLTAEEITIDFRTADFIDTQIVHDIARAAVTLLKRNKKLNVIVRKGSQHFWIVQVAVINHPVDDAVRRVLSGQYNDFFKQDLFLLQCYYKILCFIGDMKSEKFISHITEP